MDARSDWRHWKAVLCQLDCRLQHLHMHACCYSDRQSTERRVISQAPWRRHMGVATRRRDVAKQASAASKHGCHIVL